MAGYWKSIGRGTVAGPDTGPGHWVGIGRRLSGDWELRQSGDPVSGPDTGGGD